MIRMTGGTTYSSMLGNAPPNLSMQPNAGARYIMLVFFCFVFCYFLLVGLKCITPTTRMLFAFHFGVAATAGGRCATGSGPSRS